MYNIRTVIVKKVVCASIAIYIYIDHVVYLYIYLNFIPTILFFYLQLIQIKLSYKLLLQRKALELCRVLRTLYSWKRKIILRQDRIIFGIAFCLPHELWAKKQRLSGQLDFALNRRRPSCFDR